jgi:peptidoglycan/xylan/chitin deacetylase (PgdA/CDA1 family)
VSGHGVVLMYHRLGGGEEAGREEGESVYTVSVERFEEHLAVLEGSRCRVLPLLALCDAAALPPRAVALTFDDGNASDAEAALPALLRHGLHATFFITPARVGGGGYLDWDQVRALAAAGMEIGAHGWDHADLGTLDDDAVMSQLVRARDAIAGHLERPPDALSLPHGGGGRRLHELARQAGYRLVADSRPRIVRPGRPGVERQGVPRFAVRRGDSLDDFRAVVEQRPVALGRAALRHAVVRRLRAALGESAYRTVRRAWAARVAS